MDQKIRDFLEANVRAYQKGIENALEDRRCKNFEHIHIGNPLHADRRGDGLWGHYTHNGRWFKLSAFPQAVPPKFAITPAHIQDHPFAWFGRSETERFAECIIRYAQQKGDWVDFTPEEMGWPAHSLDWFCDMGFLVKKESGRYGYSMGLIFEFYSVCPAAPADDPVEEAVRQKREGLRDCVSQQTVLRISLPDDQAVVGLYLRYDCRQVVISRDGMEMQFAFSDIEGVKKL